MNKIERIALYSLFAVGLVLLTIFDFRITSSLFDPSSVFGKIFYVGGQAPFLIFGSFACSLAFFFRPKENKKAGFWLGFLFLLSSIAFAIYSGSELAKGVNRLCSYPFQGIVKYLMYLAFALPCFLIGFLPAFFLKGKIGRRKEVVSFALMLVFYALFILIFTNLLKLIAYRPRYRLLTSLYQGDDVFAHWRPWYLWQGFWSKGKYASDLSSAGIAYKLDDFLSFPSGHTIVAIGTLAIAYFPGMGKKAPAVRAVCYAYGAVVGLSRIFLGDHNATDSWFGFYLGVAAIDFLFAFLEPRFLALFEKKKLLGD